MRRWLLPLALLVVIGGGIATAIAVNDGDWDRHRDGEVTRVVDADGTETIVIREDRRFFFPFGILFIPLFIFLVFGLMRAIFWRGPWGGGGPWNGGAPGWFDEWHRRAHESGGRPASGTDPGATDPTEGQSG